MLYGTRNVDFSGMISHGYDPLSDPLALHPERRSGSDHFLGAIVPHSANATEAAGGGYGIMGGSNPGGIPAGTPVAGTQGPHNPFMPVGRTFVVFKPGVGAVAKFQPSSQGSRVSMGQRSASPISSLRSGLITTGGFGLAGLADVSRAERRRAAKKIARPRFVRGLVKLRGTPAPRDLNKRDSRGLGGLADGVGIPPFAPPPNKWIDPATGKERTDAVQWSADDFVGYRTDVDGNLYKVGRFLKVWEDGREIYEQYAWPADGGVRTADGTAINILVHRKSQSPGGGFFGSTLGRVVLGAATLGIGAGTSEMINASSGGAASAVADRALDMTSKVIASVAKDPANAAQLAARAYVGDPTAMQSLLSTALQPGLNPATARPSSSVYTDDLTARTEPRVESSVEPQADPFGGVPAWMVGLGAAAILVVLVKD